MRFWAVAIFAAVFPLSAYAAEKALMLNEQEQAALLKVLDTATKSGGIEIAPSTVYLLNKLNTAPTVVEHKDPAKQDAPQPDTPKGEPQ